MEVKTKFDVYDTIWFIGNKKSCKSRVKGIKIEVEGWAIEISTKITYLCSEDDDARVFIKVDEDDAFVSKDELLAGI